MMMPRFFFHMKSIRTEIRDEKGRECVDLGAAHDHAVHLVCRAMTSLSENNANGWMINIATATGTTPLTVLFPGRHFTADKPPFRRGGLGRPTIQRVVGPGADRGFS
jgi:hypothetical protein